MQNDNGEIFCDICKKEIAYEEIIGGSVMVFSSPETKLTKAATNHYHVDCLDNLDEDETKGN